MFLLDARETTNDAIRYSWSQGAHSLRQTRGHTITIHNDGTLSLWEPSLDQSQWMPWWALQHWGTQPAAARSLAWWQLTAVSSALYWGSRLTKIRHPPWPHSTFHGLRRISLKQYLSFQPQGLVEKVSPTAMLFTFSLSPVHSPRSFTGVVPKNMCP